MPFDIPFTVENKSLLIPIENLKITCTIVELQTITGNIIRNSSGTVAGRRNRLGAATANTYACPTGRMVYVPGSTQTEMIKLARINFKTEYTVPGWPWVITRLSDEFSLNTRTTPARWTLGVQMQ